MTSFLKHLNIFLLLDGWGSVCLISILCYNMVISKYVDDLFQYQMPPVLLFIFFKFCLFLLYLPDSSLLPRSCCFLLAASRCLSYLPLLQKHICFQFFGLSLTKFVGAVYVMQVHAFCPWGLLFWVKCVNFRILVF